MTDSAWPLDLALDYKGYFGIDLQIPVEEQTRTERTPCVGNVRQLSLLGALARTRRVCYGLQQNLG